jgi:hypothetical protein
MPPVKHYAAGERGNDGPTPGDVRLAHRPRAGAAKML